MSKPTIEKLESEIEALVSAHMDAVRRHVASVVRACRPKGLRAPRATAKIRLRRRRSAAEVQALVDALYEAIHKSDGFFAPYMGRNPIRLRR